MNNISKGLAKKLLQLMCGEILPSSQLKNDLIHQMIEDGVLQEQLKGRSRKSIFAASPEALTNYLSNQLGINNIQAYITNQEQGSSRAENILTSSDSKSSKVRTFKGFLVNCLSPIETVLNGERVTIIPTEGAFTYIFDFEHFSIPEEVLVVGVENAENFRYLKKQAYLFNTSAVLFVSRYPQSKDLINWLQTLPNNYLHYGDFDFEGLRIFRDEYYQHLGSKASFFIPDKIEHFLQKYGNKTLYDKQYNTTLNANLLLSPAIADLINSFHKYKKCLEQEVFIGEEMEFENT